MERTNLSSKFGYYLVKFYILPILILSITGLFFSIEFSLRDIVIAFLGVFSLCFFGYLFFSLKPIFLEEKGLIIKDNFKEKLVVWDQILEIKSYFIFPLYIFITFSENSKKKKVISILPAFNTKKYKNKVIDYWQHKKNN